MCNFDELLQLLYLSKSIPLTFGVEEYQETEEYEDMAKLSEEIHLSLRGAKEFKKEKGYYDSVFKLVSKIKDLKSYSDLLRHPVYVNSYSDRYGNTFLQARTSIRDPSGKIRWLNAYLGTIDSFEKGKNDPFALSKGKTLLRKKLTILRN
jgi:hypothetical protein